ncbi:ABC transporter permease [Fulvivirga ulvae]|uniref:ABC transporter permease n=1 Tax=Fulvivirga ulvae TaxID=2904245 RepID=UPI001F18EFC6|nr:ABC transporter permease [Fulvivirga ulvae]UII31887.1 ABC transporter permease [Fulvivirga ulvae]
MLFSYFKSSLKFIKNNIGFSIINLIGLVVGICVCFFAFIFIDFELNYDRYHDNADRIYRLVTDIENPTGVTNESSSAPMGPMITDEFPEVESFARVFLDYLILKNESSDQYTEENIAYADSSMFSVFTFSFVHGNPKTALTKPFSLAISRSAAMRNFGTTDCMGKTLMLDGTEPAQVTAVFEDMPENSHFKVDILLSMTTLLQEWNPRMNDNWTRFGFYTYLLFNQQVDAEAFNAKLKGYPEKYIQKEDVTYTYLIEPLKDLYLHALPRGSRYGSAVTGDIDKIYIFSIVAGLVLFIACFNFINLSTAMSVKRAKEIGVRKALGAQKEQLVFQFLSDALYFSIIAFLLALVIAALLLPTFNQIIGKEISTNIFDNYQQVLMLFFIAVLSGVISAIYPAIVLSRFNPISSLKGTQVSGAKGSGLRKALVIMQFAISIILIISTVVVYSQLDYMKNQDLGFNKNRKLVVDFHFDKSVIEHEESLKQKFSTVQGVEQVSISSAIPGRVNRKFDTEIPDINNQTESFLSDVYFVDYNFLQQYGIEVIAGRGFSKDFATDLREAMILNESAVESLGYDNPEDVIGKEFNQGRDTGLIIGVVKNFHFESFHNKVQPLTIRILPGLFTFMSFDLQGSDIAGTMKALEKEWRELIPNKPFLYFFFDDDYNAQYVAEERFGKLFISLALIAIIISCLGLLGLSAFSMAQRTKEIGIRKVLGSSTTSVLGLLTKEIVILVILAFILASPLAWYAADTWLQGFVYKINIPWWAFLLGGIFTLLIALLTVSFHTVKSARQNPVISLKHE